MRMGWLKSVGIALALIAGNVQGQETPWQPVGGPNPAARLAPVGLGAPVAIEPASNPGDSFTPNYGYNQTNYTQSAYTQTAYRPQPPAPDPPPRGISMGPARNEQITVYVPPPPPPGAPGVENPIPPPSNGGWLAPGPLFGCEALGCTTCATRNIFQSDHCFDYFISPMSNPFLFEDPRSLTEVRPIYMLQTTPHSNPIYGDGTLNWFGLQARLAVTERLSFVMNKFGAIWNDPDNPQGDFQHHGGLSEIWMGPKFTFLRSESTRTLGAFGVTFQMPVGPSQVFQDTGVITVVPYVTFAQNFGRFDFGGVNFMTTLGYAFGDERRTDYFFNSYHLDVDLFNLHKVFPLVEVNWVAYTDAGGARAVNFEGRDLINYGATGIAGKDSLTLAFGARYKFSERAQTGIAFEFPLIRSPDLLNFRMTIDFILRY